MHQLLSAFVAGLRPDDVTVDDHAALAEARWRRFGEVAPSVTENPADAGAAAELLSYPLDIERWTIEGAPDTTLDTIGRALIEIGRFDSARGWYERAVTEAEQGDIHGRVDHANLGNSIHQIGRAHV